MAKNRSNWKVTAVRICHFPQESSPWVSGVWHGRLAGRGRSLKSDLGVSQWNASNQPRGITSSLGSGWAGSRGQAHGKSDRLSSQRSIPRLLLKCDMLRGRQGILLLNSRGGEFFLFSCFLFFFMWFSGEIAWHIVGVWTSVCGYGCCVALDYISLIFIRQCEWEGLCMFNMCTNNVTRVSLLEWNIQQTSIIQHTRLHVLKIYLFIFILHH